MTPEEHTDFPSVSAERVETDSTPTYYWGRITHFLDKPYRVPRSSRYGYLTIMLSIVLEPYSTVLSWLVFGAGAWLLLRQPRWSTRYRPMTWKRLGDGFLYAWVVFVLVLCVLGVIGLFL